MGFPCHPDYDGPWKDRPEFDKIRNSADRQRIYQNKMIPLDQVLWELRKPVPDVEKIKYLIERIKLSYPRSNPPLKMVAKRIDWLDQAIENMVT